MYYVCYCLLYLCIAFVYCVFVYCICVFVYCVLYLYIIVIGKIKKKTVTVASKPSEESFGKDETGVSKTAGLIVWYEPGHIYLKRFIHNITK